MEIWIFAKTAERKTIQGKRGFYSKYIDEIDSVNYIDYIDYELLRTLRGKYFHWSVDVTSIAMVPEVTSAQPYNNRKTLYNRWLI